MLKFIFVHDRYPVQMGTKPLIAVGVVESKSGVQVGFSSEEVLK